MYANGRFPFRDRSVADQMLENGHTLQFRVMKDDAGSTFCTFELTGTIGEITDDDGSLMAVESPDVMRTVRAMLDAFDSKGGAA